jgi:hypothetical protein
MAVLVVEAPYCVNAAHTCQSPSDRAPLATTRRQQAVVANCPGTRS